jgi:hypothetical protein
MLPKRKVMKESFFLVFFSLFGFMNLSLAHEPPACPEGQEFTVEAKRCTAVFYNLEPCTNGRVRYLSICTLASALNLNSEYEVPQGIQAEMQASTESQVTNFNTRIAEYRNHLESQESSLSLNPAPQDASSTDANAAAVVTPVPEEAPPQEASSVDAQAGPADEPAIPAPVDQEELDDKFDNFDADSCQWVEDMPRRVHEAPGCGRGRSTKICVGYVVCNRTQGDGKFIRASTCSEENCSDAVACTKDRHFWSSPASENDQKYLGRDIRNLINGVPSGATAQ